MSDTGWKSAGIAVFNDAVGTEAWSNPGNAVANDDSYATASLLGDEVSYYLKATQFGLDIPSGATINGIVVRIEANDDSSACDFGDSSGNGGVYIVKDGSASGDRHNNINVSNFDYYHYFGTGSNWEEGDTDDLWGLTWLVSDINSSTFGVAASCHNNSTAAGTVYVDHIQIKVYYTDSDTPTVGTGYPLPPFKNS